MGYAIRETDEAAILEPGGAPRASVVFLHGLGADGHDFVPVVPELGLAPGLGVRFVFPHAPVRPVTLNGGYPMRAWYDIKSLSIGGRTDEDGIRESTAQAHALIDAEKALGIPANRIVLAGFSQGGAIALHAGLRYLERLAGILALSTYLVHADRVRTEGSPANRDVPILMGHGRGDPVVTYDWGARSRDALRLAGYPVDWREYPMGHEVCRQEIDDVAAWLKDRLA